VTATELDQLLERLADDAAEPIRRGWTGSLPAREDYILDFDLFDGRLREIVESSSTRPRLEPVRRGIAEKAWHGYRAGRSRLGRAYRAALSGRHARARPL
jgi:hypothetical protein